MILGVGIDLVEIPRIEANLERFGDTFLNRVLTEAERLAMPRGRNAAYVAGRFAAKEAAVKALGTGFAEGISMQNVETLALDSGRPIVRLTGDAAIRAESMGMTSAHVSISHERDMATAIVILEG